jgi:hypothetical protein
MHCSSQGIDSSTQSGLLTSQTSAMDSVETYLNIAGTTTNNIAEQGFSQFTRVVGPRLGNDIEPLIEHLLAHMTSHDSVCLTTAEVRHTTIDNVINALVHC